MRLVTVDPVGPLPRRWRQELEAYAGLRGAFDQLEVAFGRETGLTVSPADAFVATTWWTAHVAHAAAEAAGRDRFLYLIQEYEPFTFAMGSYAALAAASYELPHTAVFSTELLRGYFRRHGIGVFAAGEDAGDRASLSFQNAITAIDPPSAAELAARRPRRLLFYARPEAHAARNMFELGVLALQTALAEGAFDVAGPCTGSAPWSRRARSPRRRRDARAAAPCRAGGLRAGACASTTPGLPSCTRHTRAWCRSRWRRPVC